MEATLEKRGKGVRRKVLPETNLPVNSNNKKEVFALLTETVSTCEYPTGFFYITSEDPVISKWNTGPMPVTDYEEADTRMCLLVAVALQKGAHTIMFLQ